VQFEEEQFLTTITEENRLSIKSLSAPSQPRLIMSSKGSILLTGGTGKVSSRIAPLLSSKGEAVLVASRSGKCPSIPNTTGVIFDWLDPATYNNPFSHSQINTVFLVAPPIMDCLPPMEAFIILALQKGVKRFVLLSGSLLEVGDGPMMAKVSKYITSLGVEWAVLRPSWFFGLCPPLQKEPSR
jgi:festuclavine dehydrogenase